MRHYDERVTMFCPDPTCEGFDGVDVVFTKDTWTEPGDMMPDYCRHCGQGGLVHQHQRVDPADLLGGVIDEMRRSDVIDSFVINYRELYAAVWKEANRQRREARRTAFAFGSTPRPSQEGQSQ